MKLTTIGLWGGERQEVIRLISEQTMSDGE
jgi:hypothetical protein